MRSRIDWLNMDLEHIQNKLKDPLIGTIPAPYRYDLFNFYMREIRKIENKLNQEIQKDRSNK